METDAHFMTLALDTARLAAAKGETPIGAVLVCQGDVIARAHNAREMANDPTAHAEILVIREGARQLGRWRLSDCTLYVTLEPCPMCAGALINARIGRLVYGASDPKAGAVGTLYDLSADSRLNHRYDVTWGVLADECAALLRDFFQGLRVSRQAREEE